MSRARTEDPPQSKQALIVVTDAGHVPARLKHALQQAGFRLHSVYPAGSTPPEPSPAACILALVQDELSDPWLDWLLRQQAQPALFLDWDGESVESVVRAVQRKLNREPEDRESTGTSRKRPLPGMAMPSAWILAASIGGPEALRNFLARLPGDLPTCLILAQHIGEDFQAQLVRQLNMAGPLPVMLLEDGMAHRPGQVLVVPSRAQVRLDAGGRFHLKHSSSRFTPCIDQVVSGLLPVLGDRMGMIVFSGMSSDGVAGSHALHVAGGPVWVQTPETCVVASMVEGTMSKTETGLAGSPEELAEMLASVYQ